MSFPVFLARGIAAVIGAMALFGAADAMADRRHHGHYYGSYYYGPYYDPYHRGHRHPRGWGGAVIVVPGPVYAPPPRVIYVPAPQPPVQAVPASPVYQAQDGRYCREYQTTVTVEGRPQPSFGTACLGPDGAWRIVN